MCLFFCSNQPELKVKFLVLSLRYGFWPGHQSVEPPRGRVSRGVSNCHRCLSICRWWCDHITVQQCPSYERAYRARRLCLAGWKSGLYSSFVLFIVFPSPFNKYISVNFLSQSLVDIVNRIKRMAHGEKPGSVIKKNSTIISNKGGLSGAEKPFDAMNNIVANLLLNITRYAIRVCVVLLYLWDTISQCWNIL